jgi:hypothetical protein
VRLDDGTVHDIVLRKGDGTKGTAFRLDDGGDNNDEENTNHEQSQRMDWLAGENQGAAGLPQVPEAPVHQSSLLNKGLHELDILVLPFAIKVCIDVAQGDPNVTNSSREPPGAEDAKLVIAAELPDNLKVILSTANLQVLLALTKAASKNTAEKKQSEAMPMPPPVATTGGQHRSHRPRTSSVIDQKRPRGSSIGHGSRRKSSILNQARRRASSILQFVPDADIEQTQAPNFRITFAAPKLVVCVRAGEEDIATLEISGVHIFLAKFPALDSIEFGFVLQQLLVIDMLNQNSSQYRLLASSLQHDSMTTNQGSKISPPASSMESNLFQTKMKSNVFQAWHQSLSGDNLTSICVTHQPSINAVSVATFFNCLHLQWNVCTIARLIQLARSLEPEGATPTLPSGSASEAAQTQHASETKTANSSQSTPSTAPPLQLDVKLFLNSVSVSLNREWEQRSVCAISLAHFSIVSQVHAEDAARSAATHAQPRQSATDHGALLCLVPGFQRIFTQVSIGNFSVEDTSEQFLHRQILAGTRFRDQHDDTSGSKGPDASSLFHARFESPATALVQSKIAKDLGDKIGRNERILTGELDASLLALQIVVVHQQLINLEHHLTQVCLPSLQGGVYDAASDVWRPTGQTSGAKEVAPSKPAKSSAARTAQTLKNQSWLHVHLRAEAAEIRVPAGPDATEGLHLQVGCIENTMEIDASQDIVHDKSDFTMGLIISDITLASRDLAMVVDSADLKTGGVKFMVAEPVDLRLHLRRRQELQLDRDSIDADTVSFEAKLHQSRTHLLLTRAQFLLMFRILHNNFLNVEQHDRLEQKPPDIISAFDAKSDGELRAKLKLLSTSASEFKLGAIRLDICGANR